MSVIDELEEAVNREMKPVIAERDVAYERVKMLEALLHLRESPSCEEAAIIDGECFNCGWKVPP